jgi:hypothetical protein
MNILDRAKELRSHVSQIKDAHRFSLDATVLEDKRQALVRYRSKLQNVVTTTGILVEHGCVKPEMLPDPIKLREALNRVIEAFNTDAVSIAKGRNFTTLTGQFEKTTKEISDANVVAWEKEVGKAPTPNEALLDMVAQLPGQSTVVTELRTAYANLAEVSEKPPATPSDWAHFQTRLQLVIKQNEELNPDGFPRPVLDFCRAAQSSNGAQLSMLTDEVRNWLEEHNMIDNLRYRLT